MMWKLRLKKEWREETEEGMHTVYVKAQVWNIQQQQNQQGKEKIEKFALPA